MISHGHDTAGARTLVHLLRRTATEQPEGRVFSAVEGEAAGLTFADLDRTARAVASALQHAKVRPGERALLFYPPGLSLVPALFGCLYAGVVAVPAALPSTVEGPSPWLLSLLESCQPAVALTTTAALVPCRAAVLAAGTLEELPWLVTDAVSPASAKGFREVPVAPETAAMLYNPAPGAGEGGVVTHARLMGVSMRGPGSVRAGSTWLPTLQDLGLVRGGPGPRSVPADGGFLAPEPADTTAA